MTFRAYGPRDLDWIGQKYGLPAGDIEAMREVADVLPFRVNAHVLDELIDWDSVPDDPIFQLTFPQPGMLPPEHVRRLRSAGAQNGAARASVVAEIRQALNPHPAAQATQNVPVDAGGQDIPGLQHKYAQTVLLFPSAGQTCHAFCSYCFRWPQFVGEPAWRFAASSSHDCARYVTEHPQVTDVLITGGDPMIMGASRLAEFLTPLLRIPTLRTIRIGTKFVGYWPHRVLTDRDAGELLALLESVVAAGKNLAIMHHLSHPVEIGNTAAAEALRRLRATGASMYSQAPVMRHVNDFPQAWTRLWSDQLAYGVQPYYMFVARDTGAQEYYKVALQRALEVFTSAFADSPGLARTVRGPVMSTAEGKVMVEAATPTTRDGTMRFDLRFLQSREPGSVNRLFSMTGPPDAAWIDDLRDLG